MSSLFKDVYEDGTVKYRDTNRYYCRNVDALGVTCTFGVAADILDELFPITMPYMPSSTKYRILFSEALTDRKNGDVDTIAIHTIRKPDGDEISVSRYFKETENGYVEIKLDEYMERAKTSEQRAKREEQV